MLNIYKGAWRFKSFVTFQLTFYLVFFSLPVQAEHELVSCSKSVGHIASLEGEVTVQRRGNARWHIADANLRLCENDTIRVSKASRAALSLVNKAVLRLKQNTTIRLTDIYPEEEKKSVLEILKGIIQSFSRQPHKFAINTPYLNGSVEGTEFLVQVNEGDTTLTVLEGAVRAANDQGSVLVHSGASAYAAEGSAPVHSIVVNPRNAVQWAMFFPPLYVAFTGDRENLLENLVKASDLAKRGNTHQAMQLMEDIPEANRDVAFDRYYAALLLSVGEVELAEPLLQQLLENHAEDSQALALMAMIVLTRNEAQQASHYAQKAVSASPNTALPLLALSYVQQAEFNLEAARSTLEKAVELDSGSALAWARLAELRAAFKQYDASLAAAEQAKRLDPDLSLGYSVTGFAYLTQTHTEQAIDAFQRAITLAQGDPLPRLGLGLAKIHQGNLEEGSRDIEIAVNLDPNRSIYRSYLGKTYYEQRRDSKLVDQEFTTAKQLDDKDPTPYFYSAVQKQTTNRPVEALEDAEKAISLNNNRAVYRSKMALDEDLAARSASTARIYSDLGFQQLALVEGWKSVKTDPGNHSAHRFLADSYAVLPRHEIARVSELLQSQLLQPTNMTPIQPRLSESNLFLISAGGPGSLSFNEFNPLFNRNGLTFQSSGLVGGDDTYAGEGMVSGIFDDFSFSIGYSHFQTHGWRENSDQKDDIFNAFVQYELSPQTSIQAEYRYRDKKNGDLQQLFYSDDFSPNQREKDESHLIRLGFRHEFSQRSKLIGNFSYQDVYRKTTDNVSEGIAPQITNIPSDPLVPPFPRFAGGQSTTVANGNTHIGTELAGRDRAYGAELQHLFKADRFNLVSGGGYFYIDSQDTFIRDITVPSTITTTVGSLALAPPLPGFPPIIIPTAFVTNTPTINKKDSTLIDKDVEHFNIYAYSNLELLDNLTLTLGASSDFFDTDLAGDISTDQFNPKFGLTWNPLPQTTIRAAAFRTLKRTLITDQTLEPTQVAGFNQFYNDFNGTDSWRYGVAWDQKFGNRIYAGMEYSYRHQDVPFVDGFTLNTKKANWRENLVRGYIFWAPLDYMSFNIEYQWEKLDRNGAFVNGARLAETHRLPLGVDFFHPSGFGASIKTTYISQKGNFLRSTGVFEDARDNFWVVDAALNYRLPKRFGLISIGATNLFNEKFNYYEADLKNPRLTPGQFLYSRITLSF